MAQTQPGKGLAKTTLALLATDYTGGRNLADVTSSLILRNIFQKIQTDSEKACRILRILLPYLVLAGSAYSFTHRLPLAHAVVRRLWAWVSDPVTSSITIPANAPLNQDLLQWLVAHGLGQHPRALTLCTAGTTSSGVPQYDFDDYGRPTLPQPEPESHELEPLQFIPEFGDYTFRRGMHVFTVSREKPQQKGMGMGSYMHNPYYTRKQTPQDDDDPSAPQPLFITCFPTLRGAAPIKNLLKEIRGFSKPRQRDTTTMYRPTFTYNKVQWNRGTTRPVRTLHSVAMEAAIKDPIVDEISKYLSPEREAWYAARGIPYRKGLLLYGPPGTGKTSFSIALAGHFKLDVYVLSLSDSKTNDASLEILFDKMPRRCVVLIEDVDCAGLRREQLKAEEEENEKKQRDHPGVFGALSQHSTSLTLSGLLNVLDGPCSKEGRILLMTSNNPDSLDAALVRQGRCDHKVLFGYAGREVCEKLFVHIYTKAAGESTADEENFDMQHDIPAMAGEFADQIPTIESHITPAEVQGFLMLHLEDPVAAVTGAAAWAKEIVETKERGAIVAEFDNEIEKKKEKKKEKKAAMPAMVDSDMMEMFQQYGMPPPGIFQAMGAMGGGRRGPVADRARPSKSKPAADARTSTSLPPTSLGQTDDRERVSRDGAGVEHHKADSARGSRKSSLD